VTRYRRFLQYRSLRYRRFLRYRIDHLRYRIISFDIEDDKKSIYIEESSILKLKSSISGSDIKVIRYRSEVLRYRYMSYSISKITFCISGPISKIFYIEDLNLRYRITGNRYIVPDIEDLRYRRFLHDIESL
jgi:hypothetical protein